MPDSICDHVFVLDPKSSIRICNKCGTVECKKHTHSAPSVPGDDFDLICNAIDKADTITMEGDYMLDSDDCIAVVRVMQVLLSVRAAMLAAK